MIRSYAKLICLIGVLAAATGRETHAAALGTAFTYQGKLTENGQPADGQYDFYIHLYDSAVGGAPTNPVGLTLINVPVTDGLFTVNLDFGPAALTGEARWLNIQVRPTGGGFYTPLSPRQPLSPTPYAVHAKSSDQWISVGDVVTNANPGFVGVNRTDTVSSSEFFGVQAPVQSGYGGMYVRTDGESAKPYYGYSTGTETAWTYLDGTTGDLRIYNGGDRMTVTDTGNVGIGTTAPATRLEVRAPSDAGMAARFENLSAANTSNTVHVANNGTGSAIRAIATGLGIGGLFQAMNPASPAPALAATSSGIGPALSLSSNSTGPALRIEQGGIEVEGAGVNTPTPVFIHLVTLSSLYGTFATRIDHPLCDGQPDAILIVTQRFDTYHLNRRQFGTMYLDQKWYIVGEGGDDELEPGEKFNVLVVNP